MKYYFRKKKKDRLNEPVKLDGLREHSFNEAIGRYSYFFYKSMIWNIIKYIQVEFNNRITIIDGRNGRYKEWLIIHRTWSEIGSQLKQVRIGFLTKLMSYWYFFYKSMIWNIIKYIPVEFNSRTIIIERRNGR